MISPGSAPEVSIRGFRSGADYDALAAVFSACREVDDVAFVRSAEQIRGGFETFPGFDLTDGLRIAEVAGEVVGFAYGALDGDSPTIGRILFHSGRVLPAWRGRGIGRTLLAEAQAAARRHAAGRPGPAPSSIVFRAFIGENEHDARRLLEHDGYAIARYAFEMVRPTLDDLPSPDLPPGIEARPASAETAVTILRAMYEAFKDHWGFPEYSDDDLHALLRHPLLAQFDVWQVAWDGDEVVGGVLGFINEEENRSLGRARGYTEQIFTRREWRGRGIASALIGRNLRLLAERGMTEAALGVDAENLTGALALYERAGFRRDRTDLTYQRPA